MQYNDFYDRKRGMEEFKILRGKLNNCLSNPREESFANVFSKIKTEAGKGDVVAQDVVAYFYRDGAPGYLRENYLNYMYWEILSASNGNKFAIDKLQFFMGYAYDQIVDDNDFGLMKYRCKIDEFNYIYIIGQRICEQLVKDLEIDGKALSEQRDVYLPYRPEHFRDLRRAIDKALPVVMENMKNA